MKAIGKFAVYKVQDVAAALHLSEIVTLYRTSKLRRALASSHPGLSIQHPITIKHPESVRVGEEVSIAAYVHIWGGGGVSIGNRVMIGSHAAVVSETHDYTSSAMHRTNICAPVVIADDVWIGTHAVVMPGVTVGKGAVVGAGAVVTKNVSPGSIVVGVPARQVAMRPATDERHPLG